MEDKSADMTVLLQKAGHGDAAASSQAFKKVQEQLHQMAERRLAQENPGATLQVTMLVHDVYLQLVGNDHPLELNDRKHFYLLAARAMRRILVDRARTRLTLKRGGRDHKRTELEIAQHVGQGPDEEVLNLHEALRRLKESDPRQAEIVELRHFGGYSVNETAEILGVSASTVKQDFALAKAWLFRELVND